MLSTDREELQRQNKFYGSIGTIAFIALIVLGIGAWSFWGDADSQQFLCDAYDSASACAKEETQRKRAIGMGIGAGIAAAVAVGCTVYNIQVGERIRLLDKQQPPPSTTS